MSGKAHTDSENKQLWELPLSAVLTDGVVTEFWTDLLPCWAEVVSMSAKARKVSQK